MPDPISFPNQSSGFYDLDQNMCVAKAPAAATGGQQSVAPPPAGGSSLSEAARQLVQQQEEKRCVAEDMAAVGACARAVTSTIGPVPNLAVAAVNAFLGGVACGVAAFEAAECHLEKR